MRKIDLSIIIPCLNEKRTIKQAIQIAFNAGRKFIGKNFEVVVADNGSSDGSVKLVLSSRKARLVKVPIRGYGAALHWGIQNSKGDYVFCADADLSYDFYELGKFTKYMFKNYDLVLGSRFKGNIHQGAMPILNKYVGTPLLTFLLRKIYGIKTSDSNSGMRLIKKSFYNKLHMRNSGMEWDSEVLIKTSLMKGKYGEVPITLYKDQRNSPPRLSRFTDGWRNLKTIFLLKPNSLYYPAVFFLMLSGLFVKSFFSLSFLFLMLSFVIIFSSIAAKMINFAVNKEESLVARLLNRMQVVFIVFVLNIVVLVFLLILEERYIEIKIVISGVIILLDMWIFLIETIKTHLVNRLPESI